MDGAAAAAGADGYPRRRGPGPHDATRPHLDFRAATAIWGHFGVEWDITLVSPDELDRLAEWVAFYREVRDLLHHGDVVRADLPDPALQLDGVVAADRRDAFYRLSALDQSPTWPPGRVPLPGLDPDTTYQVCAQAPGDAAVVGSRQSRVAWPGRGSASPAGCWLPSVCRPPCSPSTSRC